MNRKVATSLLSLALGLAWLSVTLSNASFAQSGDVLVMIANPANAAAAEMNKATAQKLMLGEKTNWPDGSKVLIVLRPAGTPERAAVVKKVCGMTESEYTRHNLQALFTGAEAPTLRDGPSPAATVNFVKANRGAVGFVHKSEAIGDVKVVLTLD